MIDDSKRLIQENQLDTYRWTWGYFQPKHLGYLFGKSLPL
jgi:hypothetical protein